MGGGGGEFAKAWGARLDLGQAQAHQGKNFSLQHKAKT